MCYEGKMTDNCCLRLLYSIELTQNYKAFVVYLLSAKHCAKCCCVLGFSGKNFSGTSPLSKSGSKLCNFNFLRHN